MKWFISRSANSGQCNQCESPGYGVETVVCGYELRNGQRRPYVDARTPGGQPRARPCADRGLPRRRRRTTDRHAGAPDQRQEPASSEVSFVGSGSGSNSESEFESEFELELELEVGSVLAGYESDWLTQELKDKYRKGFSYIVILLYYFIVDFTIHFV